MDHRHILLIVSLLIMVAGCSSNNPPSSATSDLQAINPPATSSSVEKVEVIHFHATHQCYSCITVGQYAEDTVNTYFSSETKEGKITFASINIDLVQNAEIVSKYGPAGSSLWIGVYDEKGLHKEENANVWYKINDKEDYMGYLRGILDKRLQGDFS